jgi:diguanylate cyclase (GGDEF)-like protein
VNPPRRRQEDVVEAVRALGEVSDLSAMRALHAVTKRVHASLDLATTLDAVASGVAEVAGFRVVVVNLRQGDEFEVVSVAGDDEVRGALLGTCDSRERWECLLAHSQDLSGLRFIDHNTEIPPTDDIFSWVPDLEPSDDPEGWHPLDALFAPLTSPAGHWIGVLSVDVPVDGRRPQPWQLEILAVFADQAAIAIEHARMYSALQQREAEARHAATHDPLTGLANRTLLFALAEDLDQRRGHDLAALVVDLDHFKELNDEHGHAAGDAVLVELAERMRRHVTAADVVARTGGDEFVIVLSDRCLRERAPELAAVLRDALTAPISTAFGQLRVGVSIGVAVRPAPAGVSALLNEADRAMYDEKSAVSRRATPVRAGRARPQGAAAQPR